MYISIDLGGTNTRVASSKDLKSIYKKEKFTTDHTIDAERNLIKEAILKVSESEKIEAVCIGVPGIVDKENQKFGKIINIPSLSNLEYFELIAESFNCNRIVADNDAALAGLGEAVFGAGQKYEAVAYLTLSTGVGGVRVANKKLDPTQKFYEPGNMVIIGDGVDLPISALPGTFTAYSSGTGFKQNYKVLPEECEDPAIWVDYAEKLSWGINNVNVMWAPDVIVIGGGMAKSLSKFIDPLYQNLFKNKFFEIPPILKAELEDDSGLFGGFALLTSD